jgi:endogenous inhibitor of DNA gyrase (YacG/DUF329 family)
MATAPEVTREDYEAHLAAYNEAHPRRPGGCPECGGIVVRKSPKGPPPLFCSDKCSLVCERRKLSDGRAIIDLAKGWRASRNNKSDAATGGSAFSEMCSILDKMIARDQARGRSVPMLLSYIDRVGHWNHDWFTMSRTLGTVRPPEPAPEPVEENDIVAGLRSIDERFGAQLSNLEANALRFAIEKYA